MTNVQCEPFFPSCNLHPQFVHALPYWPSRCCPLIIDARATQHAKVVADSILANYRGTTVLVVGHSNTVPAIVGALGAPLPANICDAEYDNAYVVTVQATGVASVAHLHFGAVSPADAGCRTMK